VFFSLNGTDQGVFVIDALLMLDITVYLVQKDTKSVTRTFAALFTPFLKEMQAQHYQALTLCTAVNVLYNPSKVRVPGLVSILGFWLDSLFIGSRRTENYNIPHLQSIFTVSRVLCN